MNAGTSAGCGPSTFSSVPRPASVRSIRPERAEDTTGSSRSSPGPAPSSGTPGLQPGPRVGGPPTSCRLQCRSVASIPSCPGRWWVRSPTPPPPHGRLAARRMRSGPLWARSRERGESKARSRSGRPAWKGRRNHPVTLRFQGDGTTGSRKAGYGCWGSGRSKCHPSSDKADNISTNVSVGIGKRRFRRRKRRAGGDGAAARRGQSLSSGEEAPCSSEGSASCQMGLANPQSSSGQSWGLEEGFRAAKSGWPMSLVRLHHMPHVVPAAKANMADSPRGVWRNPRDAWES